MHPHKHLWMLDLHVSSDKQIHQKAPCSFPVKWPTVNSLVLKQFALENLWLFAANISWFPYAPRVIFLMCFSYVPKVDPANDHSSQRSATLQTSSDILWWVLVSFTNPRFRISFFFSIILTIYELSINMLWYGWLTLSSSERLPKRKYMEIWIAMNICL